MRMKNELTQSQPYSLLQVTYQESKAKFQINLLESEERV